MEMKVKLLAEVMVLAPLLGAMIAGLAGRYLRERAISWINCSLLGVATISSWSLLLRSLYHGELHLDVDMYVWAQVDSIRFALGMLLDNLTLFMTSMVTLVSLLVHVYSIGYMRGDPGYKRFFCYISLFTFGMLILLLANNFLQLFFGWEMVGLMSYLLIGFWFERQTATFAGLKAFLLNRVGDLGFILGIALVWRYFGSLHYADVFAKVAAFMEHPHVLQVIGTHEWRVMSVICICLFIGAMAKSAQIPLHVWLPDSMEGPTPISALIHAATMVTAGVFMVARMSPLYEYSDVALSLITVIGALGALFLGILAIVQNDIKRIVAYSTLSQLGYMMVAMGVSAYSVGIFHLLTHAMFKSLLFLGAGAVILALHHEQNIFAMGGLRTRMPLTFVCMVIGSLALVGFPGTAGFYSKDLLLECVHNSQLPGAHFAYKACLFGVLVTALYSFRLLFVVFGGEFRGKAHDLQHVHEQGLVVSVPLVILAFCSLAAGVVMLPAVVQGVFGNALVVLPPDDVLGKFVQHEYHGVWHMFWHGFVTWPFMLLVVGAGLAWIGYVWRPELPALCRQQLLLLWEILQIRYGFDWFNERVVMPSVRWLGDICWRYVDVLLIDGLCVNGVARGIGALAQRGRGMQSGYLYHYLLVVLLSVITLLCLLSLYLRV